MASAQTRVPYGIDADGRPRGVDEVANGLDCGLRCPVCEGELIARQGEVNAHHLAHDLQGSCEFEREFLMRDLIARIIDGLPSVTLPAVERRPLPNRDVVRYPAQTILLDGCDLHERGIRRLPPIVGTFRGARVWFLFDEGDWRPDGFAACTMDAGLLLDSLALVAGAIVGGVESCATSVGEAIAKGRWVHHARGLRMERRVLGLGRGRAEVRDCPRREELAAGASVGVGRYCGGCWHLVAAGDDLVEPWVVCCGEAVERVRGVVVGFGFRWVGVDEVGGLVC